MELETLAGLYAADYIKKDDALAVAEILYEIMDVSVREDSLVEQETTKKFLERIIHIMNEHDREYAEEVTKEYLSITIDLITKGTK